MKIMKKILTLLLLFMITGGAAAFEIHILKKRHRTITALKITPEQMQALLGIEDLTNAEILNRLPPVFDHLVSIRADGKIVKSGGWGIISANPERIRVVSRLNFDLEKVSEMKYSINKDEKAGLPSYFSENNIEIFLKTAGEQPDYHKCTLSEKSGTCTMKLK